MGTENAKDTQITPFSLIRHLTGLKANAFARKARISPTYWNQLESGEKSNPSDQVITRIAETCGLSREAIVGLTILSSDDSSEYLSNFQAFLFQELESYVQRMRLNVENHSSPASQSDMSQS